MPPLDLKVFDEFPRGAFTHVLFDFDGTISLLREGWQGIMAPMMIEAITGGTEPTPEIEREVHEYIDHSTGIQTIVQMDHLVELVRKHGYVPAEEIRTPQEYKAIYNARLIEPVNARIRDLAEGVLSLANVTVPGATEFVPALAERGLTMYIFSGTDREDVVREAGILGVADYFEEIWGAIGSVEEYSKEKVLRELMAAHALRGDQVLVIGDGPVELRNAREKGCAALGVCSDESGRGAWDASKERRLTAAGAQALIPAFTEHAALAEWLCES